MVLASALASAALAGEPDARGGRAVELARGGFSVLPQYRPVGFYGAPQARALGALGQGSPDRAARRLLVQRRPYERLSPKPVYPTFELIATIALAHPGGDGKYRFRQSDETVRRYLRETKQRDFLLLLDFQPGRSTFIEEVRHFKQFLKLRGVGVAIDPEWNMGPRGVPGQRVGHVGAGMINRVQRFMKRIVRNHRLPQKLLVIHQFTEGMVRNESEIEKFEAVDVVLNADGFGTPSQKRAKYRQLAPRRGDDEFPGFKLFYEEDTDLMSPREVLGLSPRPKFVVYE